VDAAKRAKIEILLSPKAALQLKCIFAVYGLNLINNFCIVANSLSFYDFFGIVDSQQTVGKIFCNQIKKVSKNMNLFEVHPIVCNIFERFSMQT